LEKTPKININVIPFVANLVQIVYVQLLRHARVIQALVKIPKINTNVMRSAAKLVSMVDVQDPRHVRVM
jgi:hypothetical protein